MRVLVRQLSALAEKYRVLVKLRRESARLEARGIFRLTGAAAAARRLRCRRLARRFPGCLRELALSPAELASRLAGVEAELGAAQTDPARKRPRRLWVAGMILFHAALRRALMAKRKGQVRTLLTGGRLSAVVVAEVAVELGLDAHQLRQLLWQPQAAPPRRRKR